MVDEVLDVEGEAGIVLTCWMWKEVLELCWLCVDMRRLTVGNPRTYK